MTGEVPRPPASTGPGAVTARSFAAGPAPHRLGARNGRLLMVAVLGYVALLSALMISRGVSITPDVLLVALLLAAIVLGRGRLFLRDWVPFIALFFAYELMRGYADKLGATVHVGDVIALERFLALGQLPTQLLQSWVASLGLTDPLSVMATVIYFLHFPLPLVVGFLLWLKARSAYYDFVAALILLALAGFVTYLVFPVAPPWLAAKPDGPYYQLAGPDGQPLIVYLKDHGFALLSRTAGWGDYVFSYAYYQMASNLVAAFPSLHAGFPFLAFLVARRAFGRVAWLLFGYFLLVVFSIVFLADHYLVDAYAGVLYAAAAYWAIIHAPGRLRGWLERLRDPSVEGARRAVDRLALGQGILGLLLGIGGLAILTARHEGSTWVALVPWLLLLGGGWRAARGLLARPRS